VKLRVQPLHRRGAALALLLAAALGLSACGSSGVAAPSATTARDGVFPRTVTHAMGNTVIPSQPKRVVALDLAFVDASLLLGADVVGYTTYRSVDGSLPDYLGKPALEHAKNAEIVGTLAQPSLEKIAALKPDLILSAKVRHAAIYDKLSQIAPTVFSETTGATFKDDLLLTGEALGRQDLAQAAVRTFEKRAKTLGDEIRAKLHRSPTASVVRFTEEPTVRLYTATSYAGVVLGDAGFQRPPGQPTAPEGKVLVDVSEENIPSLDADEVFVASYRDANGASSQTQQRFESNPLWGRLKGARRDVDDMVWITGVGVLGGDAILDDLASIFGVDPLTALSVRRTPPTSTETAS
jgi:iron complex transport system substrate-binding protein